MKITVDVDCTPLEARQFMGLPDVEPMQKAAMAQIEKRMMAELDRFSPEALFKAWLPIAGGPPGNGCRTFPYLHPSTEPGA